LRTAVNIKNADEFRFSKYGNGGLRVEKPGPSKAIFPRIDIHPIPAILY
jgi:hypothetical protein